MKKFYLANFTMDFLKSSLEYIEKASLCSEACYLLSDIVQFVWISVLTQGLLI